MSSTSDPNRFVSVINTFKEDVLNSVPFPGLENVFSVPDTFGSVQDAIDTAVAAGHDQHDPAVIMVTPDSSTGSSVTDVQFTENITLYDGIYLCSSVPHKRVNISGTLALGSTALGTDDAGNANTILWYLVKDMHFIANGGGGALLTASTAVVTRLDMIRVDMTNTGTAAGDIAMNVSATAVHTVNMDNCNLTSAGGALANATLTVSAAATVHVVTVKNNSTVSQTGATAEFAIAVDNTSSVRAYDSTINGRISIDTAATDLQLYRCVWTHGAVVGTNASGLLSITTDVAVTVLFDHCSFNRTDADLDFVVEGVVGNTNPIVVGRGNSGGAGMTSIADADIVNVTWDGGPIIGTSASNTTGTLYYNTNVVTQNA